MSENGMSVAFKRIAVALTGAAVLGFGASVFAAKADSMKEAVINERIAPVGSVNAGEVSESAAPKAAMSGADVTSQVCASCHQTGAMGAPKIGSKGDWGPRADKGMDTLMDHAVNGFNAMPPKGGNPALSDEEIKKAIEYMLSETGL